MLRIDALYLLVRARLFPAKSLILSVYLKHLDSNTLLDDNNWYISGYNLLQSDHSSRNKRGGICIYYKHSLILNVQYLREYLEYSEMKIC